MAVAVSGTLLISLDFELYWGIRDTTSLDSARSRLLGARRAVEEILAVFRQREIHASWLTVGFLMAGGRAELSRSLPRTLPQYALPRFSPYEHLDTLGDDEEQDPFHFAPSLVRRILDCPGQEVGTHSLSHFYCLEEGATLDAFRADLEAARRLALEIGAPWRSIVFPRNQFAPEHLQVIRELGLRAYRGVEPSWIYRPRASVAESRVRRALRFLDAFVNLSGHNTYAVRDAGDGPVNLPASRFLRPYHRRLHFLEPLKIRRIHRALEHAARRGEVFHLWWHPHNFGVDLQQNLDLLGHVLDRFERLRDERGMTSLNMGELAQRHDAARHHAA
jgi:peptidoglycan/xylan/chitin deacetylase (PgdA/CDA1 family)